MTRITKILGLKVYRKERFIVECIRCHTVLESKEQRDYVECKCGKVSIDGGPFIGSTITGDPSDVNDLSVWVPNQN